MPANPTIPRGVRIGDIVSDTGTIVPSLRTRSVSNPAISSPLASRSMSDWRSLIRPGGEINAPLLPIVSSAL
jgi:hypothetical protein